MTTKLFISKVKAKLWLYLVSYTREKRVYPYIYRSSWYYLLHKNQSKGTRTCYYAARPNPGAGIGHQMANWIAGYWFARQFELKFAHLPFSTQKWEDFLGFGEGETKVDELIKAGYKTRKLPLFNENNKSEVDLIKAIIASYAGEKVVFIAGQDQGYKNQYGVLSDLKRKFNSAAARKNEKNSYKPDHFNIAVHVRRTVIIEGKVILEDEASQSLRWLSNDYYEKVLKQVLDNIQVAKPISIYIFSTSKSEEFAEFAKYGDVRFCSDMDEYASFFHLIKADLLITSKSSFSYKPALINDGIKICPRNFWHSYPDRKDWILCENDGTFQVKKLNEALK